MSVGAISAPPRLAPAPPHTSPRNPTFLFYFSRGDELLNDKPYYIFCGELAKVRILWPFCTPAFYSTVRTRSYCCRVIRGADGTRIVRLVTTIRKTALIWNPLSIFYAQWCYSLIEFRHCDVRMRWIHGTREFKYGNNMQDMVFRKSIWRSYDIQNCRKISLQDLRLNST